MRKRLAQPGEACGGLGIASAVLQSLLQGGNRLDAVDVADGPRGAGTSHRMRGSPEQIDGVEAFLTEMKRSVQENRTDQYLEAHYLFHFGIYDMCRMPIVEEMIESVWLRCAPTLTLALPENIPSLKRYQAHLDTIAALRHGDADAAADAVRGDIESARRDIGQMLRDRAARG